MNKLTTAQLKAKRIAEITADIIKLKEQISQLSAELNREHGAKGAAVLIAEAIIAREVAKMTMLEAELSAVVQTSVKENSEQCYNVATEITIEQDPHPFDGGPTNKRLIVKLENGVEVAYMIRDAISVKEGDL